MSPAGGHIAAIARAVAVTHAHSRARSSTSAGGPTRGSNTSATNRRQSAARSDSFAGGACSSFDRPPPYPPPGPSGHHHGQASDHSCVRTAWRDDGSSIATASSSRYTHGMCPSARPPSSLQPSVSMQFSEARGYYTKFRQQQADLLEGPETHERAMSAHRRWLHRNRVGNLSSSYHLARGVKYRASPGAAILLYLGLGLAVIGVVITFVGVGDHAFRTLELQLIGPVLILVGFLLCGIRILICAFAGRCSHCDKPIVTNEDSDFEMNANHSSQNHDLLAKGPARKPSVVALNHNHTNHNTYKPTEETAIDENTTVPIRQRLLESLNHQKPEKKEDVRQVETVVEPLVPNAAELSVLDESPAHESNSDSELDTTEFLLCKATQTSREPSLRRPRGGGGGYKRNPAAIYGEDMDKESLEGFLEVVLRRVDGSPLVNCSPPLTPPTPPIKSVTRYSACSASSAAKRPMTTINSSPGERPEILLNPGSLQPSK